MGKIKKLKELLDTNDTPHLTRAYILGGLFSVYLIGLTVYMETNNFNLCILWVIVSGVAYTILYIISIIKLNIDTDIDHFIADLDSGFKKFKQNSEVKQIKEYCDYYMNKEKIKNEN